jgi:lipopolysaccharide assembly outer membrane protein LptD (OstA)
MNFKQNGVPLLGGAPIFLRALIFGAGLLAAWGLPAAAETLPAAAGTTAAALNKVIVTADVLTYHEETGSMSAEGRVRIWYGDLTLTADTAQADLAAQTVLAQGHVTLNESGKEIRCAQLEYDLKNKSAHALGILFAANPWYYQGRSVEKRGEKNVTIAEPLFTTCNCRRPHYHLTAGRIEIILGESLTAYHTVLYIGATPLFYFPWVWRSIKDHRPPFSIRAGYNSTAGVYVKTKFNYFFSEGNYGSLLLDLMEKKGFGTGMDQRFKYDFLGQGEGQMHAYYIRDKSTGQEHTTVNLNHTHALDAHDSLQTNLEYVSYRYFSEQFSTMNVDTYQQKSFLSYSRRMDAYYFGALVQDSELLDPNLNRYYSDQRKLPGLSFGLSPVVVIPGNPPVYFSLNSNLSRDYQRLAPDFTYRFRDAFDITPALTQTYTAPRRILTQPSLSGSLSLPVSAYLKETLVDTYAPDQVEAPTRLDTSYATSVSLTNKWVDYQRSNPTHQMQSRLTHSFSRKLAHLDEPNIREAGVTGNSLGLGLDYFMGSDFSLQSTTAYNFLSLAPDPLTGKDINGEWRAHMDPFTLNGRTFLAKKINLSWQGQYNWVKEKITTGYISTATSGKSWNLSLNTSYSYIEGGIHPQMVYSGLSAMVTLSPQLSLQSSLQYNFTEQHINNISVSLAHDLHCWEMQVGYSHYFDDTGGRDEIGFSINPKAFPQLKIGGVPGATGTGMTMGN